MGLLLGNTAWIILSLSLPRVAVVGVEQQQDEPDWLEQMSAMLPSSNSDQLQRTFNAFQQVNACGLKRNIAAVVESNGIFDANWDAETGEERPAVREVLKAEHSAYFFMVQRAFSSGMTFVSAERTYLDCLVSFLRRKHGFQPYLDVLEGEGMIGHGSVATKTLLAWLFLSVGFKDGKMLASQHLNELTVSRMQKSIRKHLSGTKREEALKLVKDYGLAVMRLERSTAKLGRLLDDGIANEDL